MGRSAAYISLVVILLFALTSLCVSAQTQPGYVEVYNPAGIRQDGVYVDKLLQKTLKETKGRGPQLAGEFPETKIEKIKVNADAFTEVNELFYRRGWTDGLPVVVPTVDKVKDMLRGTDLDPDFVIAVLDPMDGQATVEKIAVNAVMAGCRPEYMPVLIAAVEALANPTLDLRGLATTTSPDVPLLILTGPIVKEIDFNAGTNTMGRGYRANATIGRALQLVINNIGGSWPGANDMASIGNPAQHGWVVAENAEANPWPSLNIDLGLPGIASAVTITGAEGIRGIVGAGWSSEEFLQLVAAHMAGLAAQRPHWGVVVLIIGKDTAAQLARDGYTKESIREAVLRYGSVPLSKLKEHFHAEPWSQELAKIKGDPNQLVPQPFIDQFLILVAGGPGEKSMLIPGWLGGTGVASKQIRVPSRRE